MGKILWVGLGLVVFTSLVGCTPQPTSSVSDKNLTNTSAEGNTGVAPGIKSVGTNATVSDGQSQLVSMSPEALAQAAQMSGTPLPSASQDITRRVLTQILAANNPSSGSAFPNNFGNGNFNVVDQWSGTIEGKAFKLEVDMKPDGRQYVIGMTSGTTTAAVNLDKQPWITNFTGSYVVFASPNPAQGNPMFAINLTTGSILKDSGIVRQMSGITGKDGYTSTISGLAKLYDVFPTNVPYSERASVLSWKVNSITVDTAQMTVNHQLLHAFRYVVTMAPTGDSSGVVGAERFSLQIRFSGETQKLLGVSQVTVPLLLENRASVTYTATWESVYQPSYPTGTLTRLSKSKNDVTVKVLPGN